MSDQNIVVRMAPSPTGKFHVGSLRVALFNYFYSKQNNGKFILRIEDTDKERSKKKYEDNILEAFEWLGLEYDELYRQSERTEIYKKYLRQLIADDKAYKAEESEDGVGKVIRFRNSGEKITFEDVILGNIEFDTTELGDFVIAKNLETPLYHVTVVVDDHEMKISHVIRGQDHISNTARQILLLEAIGGERPVYAHVPLVLAENKSKLSKRHGAVAVTDYRDIGYLPEAMINFMALIGWHPKDDQELFSKEELISEFELGDVQKGGAVFDIKKLDWLNKEYLQRKNRSSHVTLEDLERQLKEGGNVDFLLITLYHCLCDLDGFTKEKFVKLYDYLSIFTLERIHKYGDIADLVREGEYGYFFKAPESYNAEQLVWKKSDNESTKKHLEKAIELLENKKDWSEEGVKNTLWNYAEEVGKGDVLWPIRFSLSGKEKSPDPFTLASILGKEETLKRLGIAVEML